MRAVAAAARSDREAASAAADFAWSPAANTRHHTSVSRRWRLNRKSGCHGAQCLVQQTLLDVQGAARGEERPRLPTPPSRGPLRMEEIQKKIALV